MRLAIKDQKRKNGNIFVFNTANDCSFFLKQKINYVSQSIRNYRSENKTLDGLYLYSQEGREYKIVACVGRLIFYHKNFDFSGRNCRTYGSCVIIRNMTTDRAYGFKNNSSCCKFLARPPKFLDNFKGRKNTITAFDTKETYKILQFKIEGKYGTVQQTRKECEQYSKNLIMRRKDNHQQIATLLNKIDDKYDNLIDAWKDNCPEFFELQQLENSYEFNYFEWQWIGGIKV